MNIEDRMMNKKEIGNEMYALAGKLFPICRSITGNGVRETLDILNEYVGGCIKKVEVPTGTKVFDWTIPKEWNIKEGYIENSQGEKIVDFQDNNLYVVGYSTPVDRSVTLEELNDYIYTLPDQPDVIPYVTSYYKERYGFCMSEKQRDSLKYDTYHMYIDSELKDGNLTYGEIIIPGKEEKEVFLSSYVCHPSLANNEVSGPVVLSELVKWLCAKERRYTYRIILVPETIGAITYLSKNIDVMKKNIIAGYNLTCVGDNNAYSYIQSIEGNTLADRALKNILKIYHPDYKEYSFLESGSDERRYNSPGIDLPVCEFCRTKYWEYKEYHTSADNMDYISADGLYGAFDVLRRTIENIENNAVYRVTCLCEPQLGKRGLYPSISKKGSSKSVNTLKNILMYANGKRDLLQISDILNEPMEEICRLVALLCEHELLERVEKSDYED